MGTYNVVLLFVMVEGRKKRKGVEDCLNTQEFSKAALCCSKLAQGPRKLAGCMGR